MGTRETSHRAEPHRCSHRLLSDASPSRQQAERGVNSPQFDAEVRTVFVDPGAEAGRAHGEQSAKPVFDDGRRSDRSGYGRNDREPQHPPIAPFLLPQIHSFLFGQPGLRIDGLVFVGNSPYQITPREFHPLPLKFRSVRRKCHLQSPVLIPTNACPSPLLRFVAAWDSHSSGEAAILRGAPLQRGSPPQGTRISFLP